MADRIVGAIGHHGFWGNSAGFDFGSFHNFSRDENSPYKVLLVYPGDIRHILTTVSRRLRHDSNLKGIHFYVLESQMEILCRDILLLEVLLDYEVPIRQRANIFLEIYGNCKVQERTSRYIQDRGQELRDLVANNAGRLAGMVDLSFLRHREKDEMEEVLKSYSRSNPFDVGSLRDHRLRGFYAERFDARLALSDWDWYSSLKSTASIIHIRQYKDWRMNGIAFEFGDQQYTDPNRTMMSYVEGMMKKGKDVGLKKEVKGFWADIVCSPYFSFGIDCDTPCRLSEGLFEIMNKGTGVEQHRHNTAEVAVYNMLSMLWEMETGRQYRMTKEHDIFSGLNPGETAADENKHVALEKEVPRVEQLDDLPPPPPPPPAVVSIDPPPQSTTESASLVAELTSTELLAETEKRRVAQAQTQLSQILADVKIVPMLGNTSTIKTSSRTPPGFFDAIFVSNRAAHWLQTPAAGDLLGAGGIVAAETAKFLVPLTTAQKTEFDSKVLEYCTSQGWEKIEAPVFRRKRDEDDTKDDVLFFRKNS